LKRRKILRKPGPSRDSSGILARYAALVTSAAEGAVLRAPGRPGKEVVS